MLRVLYAGSPKAAGDMLKNLLECESLKNANVEIVGVLTNPPSTQGRHKTLIPTPVQTVAENFGIPVFTPEHLDGNCREQISSLNADILVCFAYGHIFGPKFLALFDFGGINLHPSLLPKYRGCTPIPAAILNRDLQTGISVQKIVKEMDAGDLLFTEKIDLDFTETTEILLNKSAILGAKAVATILEYVAKNNSLPKATEQIGVASYTSIIKKEDGRIDWNKSAKEIEAQIRAYTPEPGCFTTANGVNLKIISATYLEEDMGDEKIATMAIFATDKNHATCENVVQTENLSVDENRTTCENCTTDTITPGKVLALDKKKGILIACKSGVLVATELQWQAKKVMSYKDFMNGSRNFIGTILQ